MIAYWESLLSWCSSLEKPFYETISNVIPAPLKHALSSLQFVPNSIEVKLKAAAEICQKKKLATATTTNGNAEVATHTNPAAAGSQPVQTLVPTSASTKAIPLISTVPIWPHKRRWHGNVNSDNQQIHGKLVPAQSTPIPSHATTSTQISTRDPVMWQVPPIAGPYTQQVLLPPLPPSHISSHAETFTPGSIRNPIMWQVLPHPNPYALWGYFNNSESPDSLLRNPTANQLQYIHYNP